MFKVNEGRPNIADEIVNRKVDLVVNTPLGRESFFDDRAVRRAAMMYEVPCITTLTGAAAAVSAIRAMRAARRRRPRSAGLLRGHRRRQLVASTHSNHEEHEETPSYRRESTKSRKGSQVIATETRKHEKDHKLSPRKTRNARPVTLTARLNLSTTNRDTNPLPKTTKTRPDTNASPTGRFDVVRRARRGR